LNDADSCEKHTISILCAFIRYKAEGIPGQARDDEAAVF